MIRGTADAAQRAEVVIRRIVADVPPVQKDTMNVPVKAIGRIIGRPGLSILTVSP